ncbi:MAG: dephospho-CoA kinase [Acidimicrobiia bacterium]
MVGLTGGIGSGKSTVAEMLVKRGAVVVDADLIARLVVEPGTPALAKLVDRFGADILGPDGALDRPKLAEKAFVDDETKRELEAITHPAIAEEFLRQVAAAPEGNIVVHDVPLLAESKRKFPYDAVIVVETPRDVRIDRLVARGIPREDAERRMLLQASDEDRRSLATWVVDNGAGLDVLEQQVEAIWQELLRRAEDKRAETADKP